MERKSWVYTCLTELADAARAHQPEPLRGETMRLCDRALAQYDREVAVIEAAKLVSEYGCGVITPQLTKLYAALEALQEVEGE